MLNQKAKILKQSVGVLLCVFISAQAMAISLNELEEGGKTSTKSKKRKFYLTTVYTHNRALVDQQDGTYYEAGQLVFVPSYRWSKKLSVSSLFVGTQSYGKEKEAQLALGQLRLHLPALKGDYVNRSLRLNVSLPVNADRRNQESYLGSLGISLNIAPGKEVNLGRWGLFYSFGLNRNFHSYKTARDGRINRLWSASNNLSLSYELAKKWSIGASTSLSSSFNYLGNVFSGFSIGQSISYQAASSWNISMGHENGGSTLKVDGESSGVQFYDKDRSSVNMSVTHTY